MVEPSMVHSARMPLGTDYAGQPCSLARTLEIVGERWTLLIVRDLFFGVRRFSDLQRHLDIPRAVLASRLAALVEAGVVEPDPYRLTERGEELWPAVHALMQWGEPRGEHRARDVEVSLEVAEAPHPEEQVAHDQQRPALADDLERARERAGLSGIVGAERHRRRI